MADRGLQRSPEVKTYKLLRNGTACYVFDGDGPRFVRLFQETWRILSLITRREILRYWSHQLETPRIEFRDGWSQRKPGVIAQVEARGRVVGFHSRYVDRMSDAAVRYVVAHEPARSPVGRGHRLAC